MGGGSGTVKTQERTRMRQAVMTGMAALSMLVGAGGVLMMLVMLLAGSANSTPQKLWQIKMMMLGLGVCAGAGVIGGVWALIAGRPGLASAIGAAPAAVSVGLFIFLLAVEW